VIAERHDKFLQPTFYRLLAVVLASQEGDFFSHGIGRISGYFARSACQFFISTLPGSLLVIRLLAFPCGSKHPRQGQAEETCACRLEQLPSRDPITGCPPGPVDPKHVLSPLAIQSSRDLREGPP